MQKTRGMRRVFRRSLEEIRATVRIAKVVSLKGAVQTFLAKLDIQIMNRNGGIEYPSAGRNLKNKHRVMNAYFEHTMKDFAKSYDYNRMLPDVRMEMRDKIWVCWWQGEEQAPALVKACLSSIRNNAAQHQVILITEENYRQYVELPEWIEKKYQAGIISRTNYSDLLRLSLLARYGGMWLDSTFFCRGGILDQFLQQPLWSIKRPDYQHASVACGYFAGYSLSCTYENRWIFATIRDFFMQYWKENDMLVDYLLIDYMIVLAQRKDNRIAQKFAVIHPNNSQCDELVKVMNKPYDENRWKEMKKDTLLFKLSWKYDYVLEKDGKETFYAKLIKGEL